MSIVTGHVSPQEQLQGSPLQWKAGAVTFLTQHSSCMQGKGLGAFHDIGELTMFADYRVPVVLRQLDILQCSPELAHKVLHHCTCPLTRAIC